MRYSLLLLGLVLLIESADAQGVTRSGFVDGRLWNSLPDDMKATYLVGFKDALGFAQILGKYWGDFSVEDCKKELNVAYANGENVDVPIWLMFRYVSLKLEGTHKSDWLEDVLIAASKKR